MRSPQYPGFRCQSAYGKAAKINHDPLEGRTILLDCRWLGLRGAGRATELLLRGLARLRPPGRWVLWGGDAVPSFVWDGAVHVRTARDPRELAGQRELLQVPEADLAVYMHQIRPLRPGRSLTLIHDTIPLRHGGSAPKRLLKRVFYQASARISTRILTVSQYARQSIERDLGVSPDKLSVVRYPVDEDLVERVGALRSRLEPREVALYVGSFLPHKNLERLIEAFGQTSFSANGGGLLLVGGEPDRADALRARVSRDGSERVVVEGSCSQDRLDELYATSRLLVLPSLEEGFGLPAWEAICCGLAVAVSNTGSLPEITRGLAETFAPTSVPELAAAVDRTAGRSPPEPGLAGTGIQDFAEEFVGAARTVAHT